MSFLRYVCNPQDMHEMHIYPKGYCFIAIFLGDINFPDKRKKCVDESNTETHFFSRLTWNLHLLDS